MPDNVKDNPVEKREALLVDRLRLHKGYRQRFVKGRNRHVGWSQDASGRDLTVSSSTCAPMLRMRPSVSSGLCPTARMASWMMYSVWNTAVASIRFRHAIGEFIHAFICRI